MNPVVEAWPRRVGVLDSTVVMESRRARARPLSVCPFWGDKIMFRSEVTTKAAAAAAE